jgi:hypothetical protein
MQDPNKHIARKLETERTQSEALVYVMDHSRAGALVQLLIIDSLDKHYEPKGASAHRDGSTNMDTLLRLLEADRLLGRTMTVDSVRKQADGLVAAGLEGVRASFAKSKGLSGMIHPDSWFRAAEDVKRALDLAQPDPADRGPVVDPTRDFINAALAVVDDGATRANLERLAYEADEAFPDREDVDEDEDEEAEA